MLAPLEWQTGGSLQSFGFRGLAFLAALQCAGCVCTAWVGVCRRAAI